MDCFATLAMTAARIVDTETGAVAGLAGYGPNQEAAALPMGRMRRTIASRPPRSPEAPMIGFTRPPCDAGIIHATPAAPAALSRRRKQLTLAATILGSSMAFIDGSVVNIALPAIQQALHAHAASTQRNFN